MLGQAHLLHRQALKATTKGRYQEAIHKHRQAADVLNRIIQGTLKEIKPFKWFSWQFLDELNCKFYELKKIENFYHLRAIYFNCHSKSSIIQINLVNSSQNFQTWLTAKRPNRSVFRPNFTPENSDFWPSISKESRRSRGRSDKSRWTPNRTRVRISIRSTDSVSSRSRRDNQGRSARDICSTAFTGNWNRNWIMF